MVLHVVLVCGLPGAGKTSLLKTIITNKESLFPDHEEILIVDYDQNQLDIIQQLRQDEYKSEVQEDRFTDADITYTSWIQNDVENDIENNIDTLELYSWRSSRKKSTLQLQQILNQYYFERMDKKTTMINATDSTSSFKKSVIVFMDDNFYLRSMRKQIFKVCEEHIQKIESVKNLSSIPSPQQHNLYFSTVFYDTPFDLCIQRNLCRCSQSVVPENVITRMKNRFEASQFAVSLTSDTNPTYWERNFLRLDGSCAILFNIDILRRFITDCQKGPSLRPQSSVMLQEQRLKERNETIKSANHQIDLFLRKCVSAVASLLPHEAAKISKVKNQILNKRRSNQIHVSSSDSSDSKEHLLLLLLKELHDQYNIELTELEQSQVRCKLSKLFLQK